MSFPLIYLVSLALCAAAFHNYRKITRLNKRRTQAALAEATIHEKEVSEGNYGKYRYILHYSFDVAEHPVTGKAEVSAALFDKTPVAGVVTVMYETHNPAVNYLQVIFLERLSAYWAMCLLLVVSAVIVPWVF